MQGGFRANRGTPDSLFCLNEIVNMRRECNEATYMCFIDVAKAYDRVWRPDLWLKLSKSGSGDAAWTSWLQCMLRSFAR